MSRFKERAIKRKITRYLRSSPNSSLTRIDVGTSRLQIGRIEDEDPHGGAQDDFVFGDDDLTPLDVAKAIRVEKARFDAKFIASSSKIPTSRGIDLSSKTIFTLSSIDEDQEMVDSTKEEIGRATNVMMALQI
ncbi:hypothetical protein CK203_102262 [Vitis vinifera]|uniref:Uncharacterized protein n=1 Tax=Vitis vinifera TaxID=29760 RepID=A0A438D374_VITVI|nr:hypothetical protein CK203_102262 [Vitis vinifera]